MGEKRSKFKLVRFLAFATPIVLFFYLVQAPIPCTRWAFHLINKHSNGLARDLHFSVEEIKVSLTGKAQFRNLKLGSPPVVSVPGLSLRFAPGKFITGKPFLQTALADTAIVDLRHWEIMDSLYREKKRAIPVFRPNQLFENGELSLKNLVVRDTSGRRLFGCQGLQIKARATETGNFRGGLRIISITTRQFPGFGKVLASWRHSQGETALIKVSAEWLEGSLQANTSLTRGNTPGFRGTLAFTDLNLKHLSQKQLLKKAVFGGKASGNLIFQGTDWRSPDFTGEGRFSIKKASMKGFPFQKELVITNFMPDLASLNFDELKSTQFQIRGKKIHFNSLSAQGSPLSFTGAGNLSAKGNINLKLHCFLKEKYYRTLKSYVRDGIPKNRDGMPNFRCRIKGDMTVQHIYLDNMVSRIFEVNLNRLEKKLRRLLK